MKLILNAISMALVLFVSPVVYSSDKKPQSTQLGKKIPSVIQKMLKDGKRARLINTFDAGSGMSGYVLSAGNGEKRIFYVTPDKKKAILGLMFDEDLNNVTADHQGKFIDIAESINHKTLDGKFINSMDVINENIKKPWLSEGNPNGLTVYVFMDVMSAGSVLMYQKLSSLKDVLRINWILSPVDSMGNLDFESSSGRMMQALGGVPEKNRAIVLGSIMKGNIPKTLPPKDFVKKEDLSNISSNAAVFSLLKKSIPTVSVPMIVFLDEENKSTIWTESLNDDQLNRLSKLGHEFVGFYEKRKSKP